MWHFARGGKQPRGLRVWVLQLLERGPRSGAELIQDMDTMTHGWWRPSPGSIYPLLEQLEGEKLVSRRPDGRYELAPAGRSAHAFHSWPGAPVPRTPAEVVREIEGYITYLEDLGRGDRPAMRELAPRLGELAQRLEHIQSSVRREN